MNEAKTVFHSIKGPYLPPVFMFSFGSWKKFVFSYTEKELKIGPKISKYIIKKNGKPKPFNTWAFVCHTRCPLMHF